MSPHSDSVAQLAAALAKAQIELVNPAKTLTGVIDRWGHGGEGQSLPLGRSRHCAQGALQARARRHPDDACRPARRDGDADDHACAWLGRVHQCRLASLPDGRHGEPETHGRGAHLRPPLWLFTLVGIAGEDDLDAPDGPAEHPPVQNGAALNGSGRPCPSGHGEVKSSNGQDASGVPSPADRLGPMFERTRRKRRDASVPRPPRPAAGSVEYALERLAAIESSDALFGWALAALPFRNELTENSRATLDAAFFEKADELGVDPDMLPALNRSPPGPLPHLPHSDL